MTKEEKQQWDDLYQYVKKEIMMYDTNQSLPSRMVLRLKGMTKGKHIENRSTPDNADYTYEIILYTFKINKSNILNAVSNKTFNDEMSKFIYIAAIVENNINDVYMRLQNAKKSKEKTETINVDNINYDGAEYIRKTEDSKITNKMNGLW